MPALFDIGPKCDPHETALVKFLLSKLRNNHPKVDSKTYARNAKFIREIYEGKFLLNKTFVTSRKDYNYEGSFEKIRACKGSWQKTKDLIVEVLENIETAKDKTYLPFNKRYIETITFATFFEHFDVKCTEPGTNSNFLNFVNPPLKCSEYSCNLATEKLKKECPSGLKPLAEEICSTRFKGPTESLRFWRCISDWSEWLSAFKKSFPKTFSEFCLNCKQGSPFVDYWSWLQIKLEQRKALPQTYNFQLSLIDSDHLGLEFLSWLRQGISSGKFAMLKNLPKPIDFYRFSEHFEADVSPKPKKAKKEVVDAEEIIF